MWVRQSSWVWSNSIVVRADDGLVLVDPGIDGSELDELADDVQAARPAGGRGVLHPPPLGPPAVAPAVRRRPALRHRGLRPDGDRGPRASAGDGGGQRLGHPPRAGRAGQPAAGGRRTRAGLSRRARGARRRSRRGPPRGPWGPARRRHALGRPDPAARPSSTEPGRRLRGGPRPAGCGGRAGRRRRPRPRRRCRRCRGGGPPRRRPRLHRRAATGSGTGRRAPRTGLARRPTPVEPGTGPRLRRCDRRSRGREGVDR